MMECFGISCFDAAQQEEEELVAEEAPKKKSSPPKRLKKKRSVKFAAPSEKSSKKLIPAPPPSPRPVCSLPPPRSIPHLGKQGRRPRLRHRSVACRRRMDAARAAAARRPDRLPGKAGSCPAGCPESGQHLPKIWAAPAQNLGRLLIQNLN